MQFLCYTIGVFLTVGFALAQPQDAFVERYLDLVQIYFKFRYVSVLTQFTCFSKSKYFSSVKRTAKCQRVNHFVFAIFRFSNLDKNAYISAKLSNESFQLRQIEHFNGIPRLIDTPRHTVQGFVVNIACDNFLTIFIQVCNHY